MAKLYQLMIGRSQKNDLYYYRDDAIESARQHVRDTGTPVSVWVAQDIEGVDELDWTTLTTISYIEHMSLVARDGAGAVDYMLGYVMTEDRIIELYAEAPVSDSDETATCDDLRRGILEQAAQQGVDTDSLVFCYDD